MVKFENKERSKKQVGKPGRPSRGITENERPWRMGYGASNPAMVNRLRFWVKGLNGIDPYQAYTCAMEIGRLDGCELPEHVRTKAKRIIAAFECDPMTGNVLLVDIMARVRGFGKAGRPSGVEIKAAKTLAVAQRIWEIIKSSEENYAQNRNLGDRAEAGGEISD